MRRPRFTAVLVLVAAACGRTEGSVLDPLCAPPGCTDAATAIADAATTSPAATSLAASPDATCATLPDGTLWCWGENTDGALVSGSTADVVPAARVGTDSDWAEVSGADGHCALKVAHTLYCWGPDDAVPSVASAAAPTQVEPQISWAQAIAGGQHHCALAQDQTLYCWGSNTYGQLGLGDTTTRTTATALAGSWTAASVGLMHTCGIEPDGSLWCWGHNGQGQLGLGDTADRETPTRVGTEAGWVVVSAGGNHTCALDGGGGVWCWGENAYGEVGTGNTQEQNAPVHLGSATYRAVASGGGLSCAIATDGTLWCWGAFGQTAQPGQSQVPAQIDAHTDWTRVAAGYSHACGVRAQGGVSCLGWNFAGQLGEPTSVTYSAVAVPITF